VTRHFLLLLLGSEATGPCHEPVLPLEVMLQEKRLWVVEVEFEPEDESSQG